MRQNWDKNWGWYENYLSIVTSAPPLMAIVHLFSFSLLNFYFTQTVWWCDFSHCLLFRTEVDRGGASEGHKEAATHRLPNMPEGTSRIHPRPSGRCSAWVYIDCYFSLCHQGSGTDSIRLLEPNVHFPKQIWITCGEVGKCLCCNSSDGAVTMKIC